MPQGQKVPPLPGPAAARAVTEKRLDPRRDPAAFSSAASAGEQDRLLH